MGAAAMTHPRTRALLKGPLHRTSNSLCGIKGYASLTPVRGRLGVGLTRVDTLMDMYGLAWRLAPGPSDGMAVALELAEAGDTG